MWSRRTAGNGSFQKTFGLYTTGFPDSAHPAPVVSPNLGSGRSELRFIRANGSKHHCMAHTDGDSLLAIFRRSGALLEGHFRLSSGLHGNGYLQCALVLEDPQAAGTLGALLADRV